MAYIWNNYSHDIFYDIFNQRTAYMEIWDGNVKEKRRAVNLRFRFEDIFNCLAKHNFRSIDEGNLIVHLLAAIDRLRGATDTDCMCVIFDRHIKQGYFGRCDEYDELTERDRIKFLNFLIDYYMNGQRNSVFKTAVENMLQQGSVYYDELHNRYMIHSVSQDDYSKKKLRLIKRFFLDIGTVTVDIWGCKYGLIGDKDCIIDKITIVRGGTEK